MRTPQHQVHRIVQVYFTSSSNISIKFYILRILTYQRFGTLGHAELPCIFFSKVRYTGLRRATWYNMSSSSFNNVSIHHLRIKLCLVLHNLLEKSVPTYLPTASIKGLTRFLQPSSISTCTTGDHNCNNNAEFAEATDLLFVTFLPTYVCIIKRSTKLKQVPIIPTYLTHQHQVNEWQWIKAFNYHHTNIIFGPLQRQSYLYLLCLYATLSTSIQTR